MEIVKVLVAAVAAWMFGAVWYMALAKPWMQAAAIPAGADGRPVNSKNAAPYLVSALCIILVAGMMRHVFNMAAMDTLSEGLMGGFGIGALFISPWIWLNNAYEMRPFHLTLINGGYATIGCTIIGAVLTLL